MSFGVVDWFVGTWIPSLELYYSPWFEAGESSAFIRWPCEDQRLWLSIILQRWEGHCGGHIGYSFIFCPWDVRWSWEAILWKKVRYMGSGGYAVHVQLWVLPLPRGQSFGPVPRNQGWELEVSSGCASDWRFEGGTGTVTHFSSCFCGCRQLPLYTVSVWIALRFVFQTCKYHGPVRAFELVSLFRISLMLTAPSCLPSIWSNFQLSIFHRQQLFCCCLLFVHNSVLLLCVCFW